MYEKASYTFLKSFLLPPFYNLELLASCYEGGKDKNENGSLKFFKYIIYSLSCILSTMMIMMNVFEK